MCDRPLDRIDIDGLRVRCVIGVFDWEREEKQDVIIHLRLYADLSAACRSDRLEDTIDYKALKKRVIAAAESSECFLVENLAQRIADVCLEDARVRRVAVRVEKPAALRFARTVAIEIDRERQEED